MIPAAIISTIISSLYASYPAFPFPFLTFSTITEPSSFPAFIAICFKGASRALRTIWYPSSNSFDGCFLFARLSETFCAAFIRATPPPATIPSSIAAFVAFTASSIFNFKYLISVSVAAPTRMTATPPESLAMRASSFSFSYFESVVSFCCFN